MSESDMTLRSERVLLEAHAFTEAKRRHRRLFQLQLEAGGLQLVAYDDRRQMIAGHWRQRLSVDQLVWMQEQPGKQLLALTFQRDWLLMRFGSAGDFHRWSERLKPLIRPLLSGLAYCSLVTVRRGSGEARQLTGKRLVLSVTTCELHLGKDCVSRPELRLLIVCLRRCQRDDDAVRIQFGTGEMDLLVFNHHEAVILQETLMGAINGCCGQSEAGDEAAGSTASAVSTSVTLAEVEVRSPKRHLHLQPQQLHQQQQQPQQQAQTQQPQSLQRLFQERSPVQHRRGHGQLPRQRKISAGNYGLGRIDDGQEFSVQSEAGLGSRAYSIGSRQHAGIPLSRIKQAVTSAALHYGHCRRGLRPMSYQPKSLDLWGSMDVDDSEQQQQQQQASATANVPQRQLASDAPGVAAVEHQHRMDTSCDFRVRSQSSCSPADRRRRGPVPAGLSRDCDQLSAAAGESASAIRLVPRRPSPKTMD